MTAGPMITDSAWHLSATGSFAGPDCSRPVGQTLFELGREPNDGSQQRSEVLVLFFA
jgi:hypothetical protein